MLSPAAAVRNRLSTWSLFLSLLAALFGLAPPPLHAASPPTLSIRSPAEGALLSSPADARFEALAYDPGVGTANGAGISAVEFAIDAAGFSSHERYPAFCAFGGDDGCQPMPLALFTQLAGGSATLRVRAIAQSGASSAWLSRSFRIASPPRPQPTPPPAPGLPVVSILQPAATARISSLEQTAFAASAFDPAVGSADGDGIGSVVFELVGRSLRSVERYPAFCMFGGDTECAPMSAIQFAALPDGNYTLRVQAISQAGLRSAWSSHSFTIARGAAPQPTTSPPATPSPLPPAPPSSLTLSANQWQLLELPLQAQRSYDERAAYSQVQVNAEFRQGERTMTVAGFWNGGQGWLVRWTPPSPGEWRVVITNNRDDNGLRAEGRVLVSPGTGRGFLRVEPASEAFVFDNGEHPTLLGTTAYEMVKQVRAGDTSWRVALSQYRAHGIGKVRLLACPWPTNPSRPTGYPDSAPFRDNDHNRLDLAHFQALDQLLARAQASQIVSDLILFADNPRCFGTLEQDERYLRYLLARYAAFPSISWTLTNEWESTGREMSYWNRLGTLVRAEDAWMREGSRLRALSIHQVSRPTFAFADAGWPTHVVVQLNHRQGLPYGDQWGSQSILANAGRGRPVVNDELGYLGEAHNGVLVDREQTRRALWAVVAAGGYGTTGDASLVNGGLVYKSGVWHDLGGLYDDIRRLSVALEAIPRWWEYRAQQGLIRAGQRVYAGGAAGLGYLVYAADGGRVELALPTGNYQLTQLDPRTGERLSLGSSQGLVTWSPPPGADWVLLVAAR